jgi:subtilisin family serine protease
MYLHSAALVSAAESAAVVGTMVIASAGNDAGNDDNMIHTPSEASATVDTVLSVANVDDAYGDLDSSSNYGALSVQLAVRKKPGLFPTFETSIVVFFVFPKKLNVQKNVSQAPGTNIMTTELGGFYSSGTGTSFAAPIVTGVAALLYAFLLGQDINVNGQSAAELVSWSIRNSTFQLPPTSASKVPGGMLNATAAFNAISLNVTVGLAVLPSAKQSGAVTGVIGGVIGCVVTMALVATVFAWYRMHSVPVPVPDAEQSPVQVEAALQRAAVVVPSSASGALSEVNLDQA